MTSIVGISTDDHFILKRGDMVMKQWSYDELSEAAKMVIKNIDGHGSYDLLKTNITKGCLIGMLELVPTDEQSSSIGHLEKVNTKIWDAFQDACIFYAENEKVTKPPKDDFEKQCQEIVSLMFFKCKIQKAIEGGLLEYYSGSF